MRTKARTASPVHRLTRIVTDQIYARGSARPFLGAVLRGAAAFFYLLVHLRAHFYDHRRPHLKRLPCRVISIGNLTLGGTGKTPLCIDLACLLHDTGYRVAIISRGYRGGAEKAGGVVDVNLPTFVAAHRYGDEPTLMSRLLRPRAIPVLVGRDRFASGQLAWARFRPDVIIMDDGFQHRRLARDLNIVLLDGESPLGNGFLLPRGPLREPPSALARADILVFTRCPTAANGDLSTDAGRCSALTLPRLAAIPRLASRHRPVVREAFTVHASTAAPSRPPDLMPLKDLPVLGFAGIARNDTFRRTLIALGADIRGWYDFPDHYRYRPDDLERMGREGRLRGARALVTTDKDRIRIHEDWIMQLPLLAVGVAIDFQSDRDAFQRLVFEKLDLKKPRENCP